jgi:hypothetical protein
MKDLKIFLGFFLVAFLSLTSLSSCTKDEGVKNNCYFTLGVTENSSTYTDKTQAAQLEKYERDVFNAYISALGMTSENNTVMIAGDYATVAAAMKAKFESTTLPEAPVFTECKYSFTMSLSGNDVNKDQSSSNTPIVSKTFTNN